MTHYQPLRKRSADLSAHPPERAPVRDLESEGNGFKRGRAPRLPGELSVEGGELPGIPNAGQMRVYSI
jgi:hypothetical protein